MQLIPGGVATEAPKINTPVENAQLEAKLTAHLSGLVMGIRLQKKIPRYAFARKYNLSRSTLYRVEMGLTSYPSALLFTIFISEGYNLNLESIKQQLQAGG